MTPLDFIDLHGWGVALAVLVAIVGAWLYADWSE